MRDILIVILSYLIGSLTSGIIITKYIKKKDVREKDFPGGAGVIRQFGFATGGIVGILDILRGVVVALITVKFYMHNLTLILSYVAVVLGNNYPIFFEFKGGQGVGVTIGFFLYIFPAETLISFSVGAVFALIYYVFKLRRILKFISLMPFSTAFGIITMFILVSTKYTFYPFAVLVIVAILILLFRGIQATLLTQRKTVSDHL